MKNPVTPAIPGDGIGHEVVPAAVRVLDHAAASFGIDIDWRWFDWGCDHYIAHGFMMPDNGISQITSFDSSIDLVIARENTEGEYSDIGGRFARGSDHEFALQENVFTRKGVARACEYELNLAQLRRKQLTSATKSIGILHTMPFWDEVVANVVSNAPDVAAAMVGSLGTAPSGNINPERTSPSMFEPVHGSAPNIAGQGIANPIAAVWSGAMMTELLGYSDISHMIMSAIEATLKSTQTPMADLVAVPIPSQ